LDELFVVPRTMGREPKGSFHVVEERMYVCGREGDDGDGGRDKDQVSEISDGDSQRSPIEKYSDISYKSEI
jgi:hypothetical protein